MAKPKVNTHQLTIQASQIADIYMDLQDEILKQIINRLNDDSLSKMKRDDVLKWQMQKMSELHLLNEDTLDYISKSVSKSHKAVKELLSNISKTAVNNVDGDLQRATGKEKQPMNRIEQVLNAYSDQTLGDLNNNVNQSLISHNFNDSAQAQAYTDIINKTVAKVVTGLKSPQQALADTVYQWQNQGGLKSGFVDKGGHHWTMQGYANTVIQSAVPRTYGAITKQRMDDYNYHLVLYPAHLSAREACAPIQGHVVNLVPASDPNYDRRYDTVYNHDYGKASGTLGTNCSHWNFTVFVPGVNTNNLHPIPPEQAIANAKVQGNQRRMERAIRLSKSKLKAAEELGDDVGIKHFKLQIRNQQSSVRQIVKKHDFLTRDYQREKFVGKVDKNTVKDTSATIKKHADNLKNLQAEFGKQGLPKTVDEYRETLYNKHKSTMLHDYISARRRGTIEPVYTYKDYQAKHDELNKKLVGLSTVDGRTITDISKHSVERALGALHDASHGNKKRIAVSTDDIQKTLTNGRSVRKKRGITYKSGKASVVVNFKGKIVTITPARRT